MRWLVLLCLFVLIWDKGLAQEAKVLVETPFDYETDENGKLIVKDKKYVDYRPDWGKRITIISADHSPVPELLDQARLPVQLELSIVKNFKTMSLGAEAGFITIEWENDTGASIDILNYYMGIVAHLDGLFRWPYVVPFASVGGMSMDASTSAGSLNTNVIIPYYRAGFLFTLNWINRMWAIRAYDDYGMMNSYLYVGARKWMETDPDPNVNLEIDPSLEFGIQLEF